MTRIGAVAAGFSRDVAFDLARIGTLVEHARRDGVQLLVLPDAALGGYLDDIVEPDPSSLPVPLPGTGGVVVPPTS